MYNILIRWRVSSPAGCLLKKYRNIFSNIIGMIALPSPKSLTQLLDENHILHAQSKLENEGFADLKMLTLVEPEFLLRLLNKWTLEEHWSPIVTHTLYNALINERTRTTGSRKGIPNLAAQAAVKGGVPFNRDIRLAALKHKCRVKLSDILHLRNPVLHCTVSELIDQIQIIFTPDGLFRLQCPLGCTGKPCFRPICDAKTGLIRAYKDSKAVEHLVKPIKGCLRQVESPAAPIPLPTEAPISAVYATSHSPTRKRTAEEALMSSSPLNSKRPVLLHHQPHQTSATMPRI